MVLMILPGFCGHWKITGRNRYIMEFGCEVICKRSII